MLHAGHKKLFFPTSSYTSIKILCTQA